MNISSAIFHCSAPNLDSCPDESLPEFAFIGRSNVGKSSLVNMMAGKEDLARVSRTPGFTKLINFFTMSKRWRLVDLPGYGYAHVAREDKSQFNAAVADYLQHRRNLGCVFALIDSGLSPQPIDLEFVRWLIANAIPFVLVFTKTDKVTPEILRANIDAFSAAIAPLCQKLPEMFTCSANLGEGRSELLGVVETVLADIAAEPPVPPAPVPTEISMQREKLDLTVGASRDKSPGKRSKSARPW